MVREDINKYKITLIRYQDFESQKVRAALVNLHSGYRLKQEKNNRQSKMPDIEEHDIQPVQVKSIFFLNFARILIFEVINFLY